MRRSVAVLVVLFALLALPGAVPVASAEDCVAVERNGVMVYPEGCTEGNTQNNGSQGGNGGGP